MGNICPDYSVTIEKGLLYQREKCFLAKQNKENEQIEFLDCVIKSIDAVLEFAEKYRLEAIAKGNKTVADILSRIPKYGATTFNEALQFLRILQFSLWCEGDCHNVIGRFDKYMYKYWKHDIENGIKTADELFELLEEFFLSLNRDNDLYPGVQKGDNGQSLMLGGVDKDGNHVFNELSFACIKASGQLLLIDPKINIRVDNNTPFKVFYEGTKLTQKGLGFPQYSNDDVVIDGLVKLGYELCDARDYTVAACWEFIIPKYGMEVPNIDAYNYVDSVIKSVDKLDTFSSFNEFFDNVKFEMNSQVNHLVKTTENFGLHKAPFMLSKVMYH